MLFLFRSAPEVEKRIHSKLFRKFWRSRGTKEPAYITVFDEAGKKQTLWALHFRPRSVKEDDKDIWDARNNGSVSFVAVYTLRFSKYSKMH